MAVRRLDLMMSQMHLELSERMDLSAAELLALSHLALDGSLGPTELVHRLHMTTGAMTALLDRLAARGFIIRQPHATDRRRIVVKLTKDGRDDLLANVHGMADEAMELAGRLTQQDRETVGRFLEDVSGLVAKPTEG